MNAERPRAQQRAARTTPHKPASHVNQTSTGQMEQLGAERPPMSSSSQSPHVSVSSQSPCDDTEMKRPADPQHGVQAAQSTHAKHSNDADAPATVQRISPITLEAIEAAIREMERRMQGAVADEEEGELGHLPDVIIATDVTQEDLDKVPAEWLDNVEVELRPGGVLVIVHVALSQESWVIRTLVRQVDSYARDNGMEEVSFPRGKVGSLVEPPTLGISTRRDAGGTMRVAFAVDVNKRSGTNNIMVVAKWFTLFPFLQRVVYVKFFPPRKTTDDVLAPIPAIGMVFRRGESRMVFYDSKVSCHFNLWRVHIEDSQSFGNANIIRAALSPFLATRPHVLLENPFDEPPRHILDASPLFPETIPRGAFAQDMDRIVESAHELARELERERADRAHVQEEIAQVQARTDRDEAVFRIEMQAPLPPIQLDLIKLFWSALQGHIFASTRRDTSSFDAHAAMQATPAGGDVGGADGATAEAAQG